MIFGIPAYTSAASAPAATKHAIKPLAFVTGTAAEEVVSEEDEEVMFASAETSGQLGPFRTSPYVAAVQRATPFVHPKPAWTVYSPPEPEESTSEMENFSNICWE